MILSSVDWKVGRKFLPTLEFNSISKGVLHLICFIHDHRTTPPSHWVVVCGRCCVLAAALQHRLCFCNEFGYTVYSIRAFRVCVCVCIAICNESPTTSASVALVHTQYRFHNVCASLLARCHLHVCLHSFVSIWGQVIVVSSVSFLSPLPPPASASYLHSSHSRCNLLVRSHFACNRLFRIFSRRFNCFFLINCVYFRGLSLSLSLTLGLSVCVCVCVRVLTKCHLCLKHGGRSAAYLSTGSFE